MSSAEAQPAAVEPKAEAVTVQVATPVHHTGAAAQPADDGLDEAHKGWTILERIAAAAVVALGFVIMSTASSRTDEAPFLGSAVAFGLVSGIFGIITVVRAKNRGMQIFIAVVSAGLIAWAIAVAATAGSVAAAADFVEACAESSCDSVYSEDDDCSLKEVAIVAACGNDGDCVCIGDDDEDDYYDATCVEFTGINDCDAITEDSFYETLASVSALASICAMALLCVCGSSTTKSCTQPSSELNRTLM